MIIGLIIAGVLKGQEMINGAKVKNLIGDFKNVQVYVNGYQDKYRAMPGDDANSFSHVGSNVCSPSLAGKCTPADGTIDGNWNDTTSASESFLFWQQVRLSGYAPGSTDISSPDYLPLNAVGGRIGVTNSGVNVPIIGMKGAYIVCSDSIPGKFAKQLDTALDDGNTATGSVMVTVAGTASGGTAIATTDLIDDQPYLVCMSE